MSAILASARNALRQFAAMSPAAKVKTIAIAAGICAAVICVPPVRGIVGFIAFATVTLSFFLWLGEGQPSKIRTVAQIAFVCLVAGNVALYGRESLTAKVVLGTLRSIAGGQPGCSGPAPDSRCER